MDEPPPRPGDPSNPTGTALFVAGMLMRLEKMARSVGLDNWVQGGITPRKPLIGGRRAVHCGRLTDRFPTQRIEATERNIAEIAAFRAFEGRLARHTARFGLSRQEDEPAGGVGGNGRGRLSKRERGEPFNLKPLPSCWRVTVIIITAHATLARRYRERGKMRTFLKVRRKRIILAVVRLRNPAAASNT